MGKNTAKDSVKGLGKFGRWIQKKIKQNKEKRAARKAAKQKRANKGGLVIA